MELTKNQTKLELVEKLVKSGAITLSEGFSLLQKDEFVTVPFVQYPYPNPFFTPPIPLEPYYYTATNQA